MSHLGARIMADKFVLDNFQMVPAGPAGRNADTACSAFAYSVLYDALPSPPSSVQMKKPLLFTVLFFQDGVL